jgi:dipeptidyl aminopeptidase/acylaminoacyl peptidase
MRFGISSVLAVVVVACGLVIHSIGYAAEIDLGGPERSSGDEISFIGPDGGLWLTQTARGSMRLLLAQGEFADYFWAPDGSRIAYIAADGSLSTLEVVSGKRVRLSDAPVGEVSWSPGSDQVIFTRDQHLWLIAARGGTASRLTEWSPSGADRLAQLLWSSDGRYAAFQMSREQGTRELAIIEVKGRKMQTYHLASSFGATEAAAISPDGRTIVVPHWQQGETSDAVCRRFGSPLTAAASSVDGNALLTQVVETVTLPSMERRAVACWPLSDAEAISTGWLPPSFLRDGQVALVPAIDAPSGIVAVDRSSGVIDPRTLSLVSLAEEGGKIERRYPTEVTSNGRVAAVAYRQDVVQAQGVWFSIELHLVEPSADGGARRDVLLRDGCFCPDDGSDTNVSDLRLSADSLRIAFTYFQNGVNRVAVASRSGDVTILGDGERPLWRPSE